ASGRIRADHRGRRLLPGRVSTRRMDKLVKTLGIDSLSNRRSAACHRPRRARRGVPSPPTRFCWPVHLRRR
ncbi:putative transposase, partial [Mycobacterium xenopi 4042]